MTQRSKFNSLTLVNWNGFFARTFDLDDLVTTLSGGNGAGKSTTMAAFVTALIPDQTLLHFRNTTEAGSSKASRDKGLYGKLQRGDCYALVESTNSRGLSIWFGVHLEQVANRDNKVDIKAFTINDTAPDIRPVDLLLEPLSNGQGRVRNMKELSLAVQQLDSGKLTRFNSITEYHNSLFDLGITAKKMRDQKDRSKYYRLIEASLYGGISSAITRSLRDYLLPDNAGVRQAFRDMEMAIRENHLTLEAIKRTQNNRNLFRNLIRESTNYVAADYVRLSKKREFLSEGARNARADLLTSKQNLHDEESRVLYLKKEQEHLFEQEKMLSAEYEQAQSHLQMVQKASMLNKKIESYREELELMQYQLEEQQGEGIEQEEILLDAQLKMRQAQQEVDSLKTQLSDFQQALNSQQTRALQYRQAVEALEQAKQLSSQSDLTPANAKSRLQQSQVLEQKLTEQTLAAEQKLSLASAAVDQFEIALELLDTITGEQDRERAWPRAQALQNEVQQFRMVLERSEEIQERKAQIEQQQKQQQQVSQLVENYASDYQHHLGSPEDLEQELERQQQLLLELTQEQERCTESTSLIRHQRSQFEHELGEIHKVIPEWTKAQESLDALRDQTELPLLTAQDVTRAQQDALDQERQKSIEKVELQEQKRALEQSIRQLQHSNGEHDPRLNSIAEQLAGTLISDVYDDIAIEDAPYYEALYGGARQGIVVGDLETALELVSKMDDLPDDLYLIQGRPDAFDENLFTAEEVSKAVLVQDHERIMRYSRFPEQAKFGAAAREQQVEQYKEQLDTLIEKYGAVAYEHSRLQRLCQLFNTFISDFLNDAFIEDPESRLSVTQARLTELNHKEQANQDEQIQLKQRHSETGRAIQLLQQIQPVLHLISETDLTERNQQAGLALEQLQRARSFMQTHKNGLDKLMPLIHLLREDPAAIEDLRAEAEALQLELSRRKALSFALADLADRLPHFEYADASEMLAETSELSTQLKTKLKKAEQTSRIHQDELQRQQSKHAEVQQALTSVKMSYQAKQDVIRDLDKDLSQFGLNLHDSSEAQAQQDKDELYESYLSTQNKRTHASTELKFTGKNIEELNKRIQQVRKQYKQARAVLVQHKVSWSQVERLSATHGVKTQLDRRELRYLDNSELRSISDKALGALRQAVADNEDLRDALRVSEDAQRPDLKVSFYLAVLRHLRQRIDHKVLRTDDPLKAVEEMEVELNRLADELSQREESLSLSSQDVAHKLGNIIRREQRRVNTLNQGLQRISFGQVHGVRLRVTVRDAYARLLKVLGDQSSHHQDLFKNSAMSFSAALGSLFRRLNPHIENTKSSAQLLGDELLDYRNYLELDVEVQRGADGWLRAESGALSTGEAIGTGQAILLMVLQSWEQDSARLRGKDNLPCRLLFLDEAARLDANSINTLFELCERQDMQLLIAAPENISPEQGTTFKLIRKIHGNQERVHVVGLRGFSQDKRFQESDTLDQNQSG